MYLFMYQTTTYLCNLTKYRFMYLSTAYLSISNQASIYVFNHKYLSIYLIVIKQSITLCVKYFQLWSRVPSIKSVCTITFLFYNLQQRSHHTKLFFMSFRLSHCQTLTYTICTNNTLQGPRDLLMSKNKILIVE